MCGLRDDDGDEVLRIKGEKFHLDYDIDAKLEHSNGGNIDSWENTCIIFHMRDSRCNSVARNRQTRAGFM